MAKSCYEILGVNENATQAEIKRAYYRLVRQHAPEVDPEGFKEIRSAYEQLLTSDGSQNLPTLDVNTLEAKVLDNTLTSLWNARKWKAAIDTCQLALEKWPDSSYFKYYLMLAYKKNGNSGKAVSLAKELYKKEPANRLFIKELGIAYFDRGFVRKAIEFLRKAYDLGVKESLFLYDYAACLHANKLYTESQAIAKEIISLYGDNDDCAFEVLLSYEFLTMAYDTAFDQVVNPDEARGFKEISDKSLDFIISHPELGDETSPILSFILPRTVKTIEYLDLAFANKACRAIKTFEPYFDAENTHNMYSWIKYLEAYYAAKDKRLNKYMIERLRVVEGYSFDSPEQKEFKDLDTKLCLLKARVLSVQLVNIMEKYYPHYADQDKELLSVLKDSEKATALIKKLKPRYSFLETRYIGVFYTDFPRERSTMFINNNVDLFSQATSKYSKPAIGRNDKCPCGSGKKFKKCCMGKRIYD